MNFYNALQVLSLVVALTGCGQAPTGTDAPLSTFSVGTSGDPIVTGGDDNAPAPVVTPPAPGAPPVSTVTYTMANRRLCVAIRDLDVSTTQLKIVPASLDYYYSFGAPEYTYTMTPAGLPEEPQGQIGYVVLIFSNQQVLHAGDPSHCRVTVHTGVLTNFETTGF